MVDKVALGQVFSENFGFHCQFSFHRELHTHHLPSGAGTIGQIVAGVPSGRSLTPTQEKLKTMEYRHSILSLCTLAKLKSWQIVSDFRTERSFLHGV
jgi:hypothetical protein